MDDTYDGQLRGDRGAYERYLAGMDASMQQKVALTAAHLLCLGKVADMGMGSGTGSYSLAALYPGLTVVGVDVSEEMVAIASDKYDLSNLSFIVGDIAEPVFEDESLDGILDSSVLHHVTTFNGYDHGAAARALSVQARALKPGGVLVVRDFLAPDRDDEVWLDIPADDGDDSDDPRTCSTAALLQRFAGEFRSLSDAPGFPLQREDADGLAPGRRRYRLSRRMAIEFLLRKDYRRDWETEVKEEYTYFDQAGFEHQLSRLGLRTLASTPIRNPWIVAHRFAGRFELRDLEGRIAEHPATNYVIVGERVPAGHGVRWQHTPADRVGFLSLEHYERKDTGTVMDVVRRPHLTIDAVPWFVHDGDLRVLARMSYPRPLLSLGDGDGLDGSRPPGWVTEPLTVIADDKPVAQTVEEELARRADISPDAITGFALGPTWYPSPGGIQEEVRTAFVEIEPTFARTELPSTSGFSSSGRVGAIEACQLLRAAQVGGLPDARLEAAVYELLRRHDRSPGPWIGESIELPAGPSVEVREPEQLAARPLRRAFRRVDAQHSRGFLEVGAAQLSELDHEGSPIHARVLEYVRPRPLSCRTIATALLRRDGSRVVIGVDDDDLPAAQAIGGHSSILVTPAWRLPRDLHTTSPARAWVAERLRAEYGATVGRAWELGGRYHPAPGSTPEVVHPVAFEVTSLGDGPDRLTWVPLSLLLDHPELLVDGHLRIVAMRAAHALGLL